LRIPTQTLKTLKQKSENDLNFFDIRSPGLSPFVNQFQSYTGQ